MPQPNTETANFILSTLEELYYQNEEPISETFTDDLFEAQSEQDFIPSNWQSYE